MEISARAIPGNSLWYNLPPQIPTRGARGPRGKSVVSFFSPGEKITPENRRRQKKKTVHTKKNKNPKKNQNRRHHKKINRRHPKKQKRRHQKKIKGGDKTNKKGDTKKNKRSRRHRKFRYHEKAKANVEN